ncbi:MAG: OadG-related small transporter subunit [Pseudomonadota bacterium]
MDQWTFGLTMTLVGVTGTFITMIGLIVSMNVLKRIFPLKPVEQNNTQEKKS